MGGAASPLRRGAAVAAFVGDHIVHVQFTGHVTGAVTESVLPSVRDLIAEGARGLIVDAMDVPTFDGDVRKPGFVLLSLFREAGLTVATAAIPSGPVRMIGSAVSFAARLPVEFFATFDEALARAEELAAKKR